MTLGERTIIARQLWASVRRLVPKRSRRQVDQLQVALEAVYNDNGDALAAAGFQRGREVGDEVIAKARRESFNEGMLAVQRRSDYRDLENVLDPEELRSTH